jgi:hypothetical protein
MKWELQWVLLLVFLKDDLSEKQLALLLALL